MRLSRSSMLATALCLAGAAAGRAEESPAADALAERVRVLEANAREVDQLKARLRDTEGEVGVLKERLSHYEAASAARPQNAEQVRQDVLRDADGRAGRYGGDFDLHFWGWISFWADRSKDWESYWRGELQLGVTKSFSDRVAAATDINFVDFNGKARVEVEQLFLSVLACPQLETLVTAGKFNAPFGIEPRDFWFRLTSTRSFAYNAQPHDLVGVMVTQPLQGTGVTLRPFIVNGFGEDREMAERPSAGMTVQFQPLPELTLGTTHWAAPDYGGEEGDPFYLGEVEATLRLPPRVTLQAEYLYGVRGKGEEKARWDSAVFLANYDIDPRWRVFGRWSYLNDPDGEITGVRQRLHEVAAGFGYRLVEGVELRGEYRHDFSNAIPDDDKVYFDITFGY